MKREKSPEANTEANTAGNIAGSTAGTAGNTAGNKVKRLNLEEIGRLAGVSRSTVSRVVNGEPNVSPDARRRVEAVISL